MTDKPADPQAVGKKADGLHLTGIFPRAPPGGTGAGGDRLSFGAAGPKVTDNAVRQAADGSLALLATTCEVHATNANSRRRGTARTTSGTGRNVKDYLTWDATIEKGGTFDVAHGVFAGREPAPAEIEIEFGKGRPGDPGEARGGAKISSIFGRSRSGR